jgi:acyl-CoA synthetase (AMP-forming)/AMP-acid ligase II
VTDGGFSDEDGRIMARQGHAFVTADEARVVYAPQKGESDFDELRDVPPDGKTLGEIVVRGNIVMKEYFNDKEATRKAFRGRHFNSGDLAVRNSDGSISILDRSKDLIISGGENASSLAIEQGEYLCSCTVNICSQLNSMTVHYESELAKHPHVLEVAVVGRPHHKWGERAHAFVVLQPHCPLKERLHHFEDELKKFAARVLPGFARPEWVSVVAELPKTGTGKVLKHVLRGRVAKL